ncbi:MAG: hypothetical protein HY323_07330 [Betaproteobacteria bacterium]|nr:hypothetical protein [Betaproteobacteria bacterium]
MNPNETVVPAAPKPPGVRSIRVKSLGDGWYAVPGIGRVQGKDAAQRAAAEALAAMRG